LSVASCQLLAIDKCCRFVPHFNGGIKFITDNCQPTSDNYLLIDANGLGKRFQRDWIFRGLTRTFRPGSATAVLGPNGAGKSTLLNTFSGQLLPTEGTLTYSLAGRALAVEDVPRHLAYAAPYLELLEEMTLMELLRFHTQFKPLQAGVSIERLVGVMYLEEARQRLIREFSSGMKQRLKLGLALYAEAPLLLLDEPTTEYGFCDEQLLVTDFQPAR
jgi:ABC-type multidrug transport system ATPase subunit